MRWLAPLTLLVWVGTTFAASLQTELEALAKSADAGDADVSVHVADLRGRTIASIEADRKMIPASNMKLITTAAAAHLLGEEFVFRTRLHQHGGDLVIVGDGDPAFGDPAILHAMNMDVEDLLARWVEVVHHAGVKRVERVLVDDRVFDDEQVHPAWPLKQLNRWYCAPVAGLNFNDNCLDIFARPTRPGQTAIVSTRPVDAPVVLSTLARTGSRNSLWASRRIGSNEITVHGEVRARFRSPIYVTVHDPPTFFARVFADRLEDSGLEVEKVGRVDAEHHEDGRLIAEVQTPIDEVLKRCNRASQNLFAEALLKRMGHEVTGEAGSWSNGAAAIRMFLARKIGPAAAEMVISDGSGMSRENRVTASGLTALLGAMHDPDDPAATMFFDSLPVAGESGTLRRRFGGFDIDGEVRAKSGYLNGVYALSGYIIHEHETFVFSILLNDSNQARYRGSKVIDRMVDKIDAATAKAAASE